MKRFITFVALAVLSGASALGQDTLRVGVKETPPFSMKRSDGTWNGVSIDLWEEIADDLNIKYKFIETDLQGLVSGLQNGKLDASISALSVTAERERIIDFSHPYYNSELGIAVKPNVKSEFYSTIRNLLSLAFAKMVLGLMVLLLFMGLIMWLIERKRNPAFNNMHDADEVDGIQATDRKSWWYGLGSGMWWAVVTLATVGYGDKAPLTFWGRVFAGVWMFASMLIVISFTATMTSIQTSTDIESRIRNIHDLRKHRVVTVAGSSSERFLNKNDIKFTTQKNADDCIAMLRRNKSDAVLFDAPVLKYIANRQGNGLIQILPLTFDKHYYGIALPQNSPLRKRINQAILDAMQTADWQEIQQRYMGEGETK
jgi:polar amino acid transport system substrate-binding protein